LEKNSFVEFWYDLFFKPKVFLSKNLTENSSRPVIFTIALIVYGLGFGISRANNRFSGSHFAQSFDSLSFLFDWLNFWAIALILGTIIGLITYFLGGFLYNLRVIWSKGIGDYKKSRQIFLYSGTIPSILIIAFKLASMLSGNMPKTGDLLDPIILILLVLIHNYYMVYIRYLGATTLMNTDEQRSKIWFIGLPVLFNTILYGTMIVQLVMGTD